MGIGYVPITVYTQGASSTVTAESPNGHGPYGILTYLLDERVLATVPR